MAEGGDTTTASSTTTISKASSDGVANASSQGDGAAAAAAAPAVVPGVSVEAVGTVTEPAEEYTVDELLDQYQNLIDSMLSEGILDEQFSQLQMLQDESTPDFVEEVVTLYFDDSDKLLEKLVDSLKDPIDYKVVDGHVHQFKGSSSSIGAQRIKNLCITFRPCCEKHDKQGCLEHLKKVLEEFNIVRTKLGEMLELEKQIIAAGGQLPCMEF